MQPRPFALCAAMRRMYMVVLPEPVTPKSRAPAALSPEARAFIPSKAASWLSFSSGSSSRSTLTSGRRKTSSSLSSTYPAETSALRLCLGAPVNSRSSGTEARPTAQSVFRSSDCCGARMRLREAASAASSAGTAREAKATYFSVTRRFPEAEYQSPAGSMAFAASYTRAEKALSHPQCEGQQPFVQHGLGVEHLAYGLELFEGALVPQREDKPLAGPVGVREGHEDAAARLHLRLKPLGNRVVIGAVQVEGQAGHGDFGDLAHRYRRSLRAKGQRRPLAVTAPP